ncbi:hypothetical protein Tsubulata_035013 [Turnera subulata]|uniref:Vacuolar ATPase assembly protein VMA22 n=1 Tax=Turnera subulata TaxID=218843 RepID=A0A9Q0FUB9_9ROSI|nr:hypothetical protein Tsubulata_035013 [Turnera subulata]
MEEQETAFGTDTPSLDETKPQLVGDQDVLQFLDSMDSYLALFDSLSSTLREGWFDLASARHSMGTSRVNGALLDLKPHSAATSLQVTPNDVESVEQQPRFILRKWVSSDEEDCSVEEQKSDEDKLRISEKISPNGAPLDGDDQVQKERSKKLAVFGTLVSPKLRTAQLSFETALDTLVQIANMRSAMLSAFHHVDSKLKG